MGKIIGLQFKRQHGPYSAGERAGFPKDEAETLVKRGLAAFVDRPPKNGAVESPSPKGKAVHDAPESTEDVDGHDVDESEESAEAEPAESHDDSGESDGDEPIDIDGLTYHGDRGLYSLATRVAEHRGETLERFDDRSGETLRGYLKDHLDDLREVIQ